MNTRKFIAFILVLTLLSLTACAAFSERIFGYQQQKQQQQESISTAAVLISTFAPILVLTLIPGILSHMLAKRKGYTGYFFTGLFLSIFGLIYVAGLPWAWIDGELPDSDAAKIKQFEEKKQQELPEDEKNLLSKYQALNENGRQIIAAQLDVIYQNKDLRSNKAQISNDP